MSSSGPVSTIDLLKLHKKQECEALMMTNGRRREAETVLSLKTSDIIAAYPLF